MQKTLDERNECIYYDWGKTAPSSYGAFCSLTKKQITCHKKLCKKFFQDRRNGKQRRIMDRRGRDEW